jgi:signal transduction histidine kinase
MRDGVLDEAREPIAASWLRSRAAGVDPARTRAPTLLRERRDVAEHWRMHPLESAVPVLRRWLARLAEETKHLIVVTDAGGVIMLVEGDPRLRSAAADAMNFVEGSLWSESGAGTNAIGAALAADHPIQVHASEHFSEHVHAWTCSAAPIHDPEDGHVLGVIDLTGRAGAVDPQTTAAVIATARAVESELRVDLQLRDARLRRRFLELIASTPGRLALVSSNGRVIADDPNGFVGAERVDVPVAGGFFVLPDGSRAFAEPLETSDAFVVRAKARQGRLAPTTSGDIGEWRRTQLELGRFADQEAALRQVATLVAAQARADEIFAAVAEEVSRLLQADRGIVARYEPDGSTALLAFQSRAGDRNVPPGTRLDFGNGTVAAAVRASGRPSRRDDYSDMRTWPAKLIEVLGPPPTSAVGAPILVDGRVWGSVLVVSMGPEPLPPDTEARLTAFAELAELAIANAVSRTELEASRARIVAASDESRQRIERDLHDGAQQRLVSLVLRLHAAAERLPPELREELAIAREEATAALEEVRRVSHGLHPVVLSRHGLAAALRELARVVPVPVDLDVSTAGRYPQQVEIAAYHVAAEALTNAAKYSDASVVRVSAAVVGQTLRLAIRDDGIGGADPVRGSGLTGLRDRVEAVGGTLTIESPPGEGTTVLVALPLATG